MPLNEHANVLPIMRYAQHRHTHTYQKCMRIDCNWVSRSTGPICKNHTSWFWCFYRIFHGFCQIGIFILNACINNMFVDYILRCHIATHYPILTGIRVYVEKFACIWNGINKFTQIKKWIVSCAQAAPIKIRVQIAKNQMLFTNGLYWTGLVSFRYFFVFWKYWMCILQFKVKSKSKTVYDLDENCVHSQNKKFNTSIDKFDKKMWR